jgi:hypothetical protein
LLKINRLERIFVIAAHWSANLKAYRLPVPPFASLIQPNPMLKRKKPTKALEKSAREVKNSDEFVDHIANIADRYRREHALDASSRGGEVRKAMRDLEKHAAALSSWLRQAHKSNQSTAEADALGKIGAVLYAVPSHAIAESEATLAWLAQMEKAASQCLLDAKLLPRKTQPNAPRIAAEALRATFEYHKLKWSATVTKQKQSDAVKLLCAIAKNAADASVTPEVARSVLRALSGKPN